MSDERLAQIRARLSDEWPDGEGVECVPGKCGGAPCLVGTRWPVIIWWQCLESFETPDATDAAVLAAYDWLTPEQVATARAYCLANQLPFIARREFNHHAANVIDLYRDDVPYLIQALADAEARLATLAALDPIVRYGSGWYACHFCDQEHNHRNVTHAEDCPWVLATDIRDAKGGDAASASELVCDLCGETAGVRVYDDDGTAICPAHVPQVFASVVRRLREAQHALADAETRAAQLTRAMAEMGALAHDLAGMEHGARCEQMRAMHQLGIIATEESLAAHLARADAFTARQYERIDAARPDAGDTVAPKT